ncbi:hypothetical protein F4780DRAFT_232316 [Xylariomycetidae sp. FL0641]|nr:hypothetical protein F4780DRAFT_232316 [Xylariomycetidae sp. FL0641]
MASEHSEALSDNLSDDYWPQPARHGEITNTTGPLDKPANRDDYSDKDVKILWEIVVRAQIILTEDLTPTSRLPTHALFLAYDEVLPQYGLRPEDDQHISKLVFMVGGIKDRKAIKDKFLAVMERMNIDVAFDENMTDAYTETSDEHTEHTPRPGGHPGEPNDSSSEPDDYPRKPDGYPRETDGYPSGHQESRSAHIRSVSEPAGPRSEQVESTDEPADSLSGRLESISEHAESSSEHAEWTTFDRHEEPPASSPDHTESAEDHYEQHLASNAEAFRKKYHAKFAVVSALRQWQKKSQYISNVCDQLDAARQADLEDGAEDKFNTWRAAAAEAQQAAPTALPPNVYSKRLENIAARTHEILSQKKALRQWRQSAREQCQRAQDMQLEYERQQAESDPDIDLAFAPNKKLARLAGQVHKNLQLSRAFTQWSNRAEEEAEKAQMAAKAYEMNLKAKTFGLHRRLNASGLKKNASQELPADNSAPVVEVVPPHPRTTPAAPVPVPVSATRAIVQSEPTKSQAAVSRGAKVVHHGTQTQTRSAPENAVPSGAKAADEADEYTDDDEMDEKTMLARRHILRMRYLGAWESYTVESKSKIQEFQETRRIERLANTTSAWREEASSSQEQERTLARNADRANFYINTTKALPVWREKAQQSAEHETNVLETYAERANYHRKATKALPVLRNQTQQAEQRDEQLQYYAERANFYYRTSKIVSVWRVKAKEVAESRQVQENYAERADYYYSTRNTLLEWQSLAKQRRKERLKEAHLETRRIVKKSMGARCVKRWREKLQPSYDRYESMNANLEEAIAGRGRRQTSQAFHVWRERARELNELTQSCTAMKQQQVMEQWREVSALHEEMYVEAEEHWEEKAKSRALRNWNLNAIQNANRPEMVAIALEKKNRRLLRQGFEGWYSRTADKLVPLELPDGTFRSADQMVREAREQSSQNQARGLLQAWKEAARSRAQGAQRTEEEAYAPTPGRPQLLLGSLGRRETTTPLAPVPTRGPWQGRSSIMGGSEIGGRNARAGRSRRNLRVSWAA